MAAARERMAGRLRPLTMAVAVTAAVVGAGVRGRAAEWYARGIVSETLGFDDNVGVTERDAAGSGSSTTSAVVDAGFRHPVLDVNFLGRVSFDRFFSQPDLNSNDQAVSLGTAYRTERSRLTLGAGAVFDTTRSSQFDDTGFGIRDNAPRRALSVNGGWSYQATRLDTFNVFAAFQTVVFPDGFPFFDTRTFTGGLGYARPLTRATQLRSFLSGQHFTSDRQTTDSVSLVAGGSYALSPALTFDLVAGPRISKSRQTLADADTTSVGASVDGGVGYRPTARTGTRLFLSNALAPSSSGQALNTTRFGVSLNHQVHRHVDGSVFASYLIQRSLEGGEDLTRNQQRNSIDIGPGIRWRITEELDLNASYRLRMQRFDQSEGEGLSSAFFLTLSLRTPTLATSR